jgi:hypothetical protein
MFQFSVLPILEEVNGDGVRYDLMRAQSSRRAIRNVPNENEHLRTKTRTKDATSRSRKNRTVQESLCLAPCFGELFVKDFAAFFLKQFCGLHPIYHLLRGQVLQILNGVQRCIHVLLSPCLI